MRGPRGRSLALVLLVLSLPALLAARGAAAPWPQDAGSGPSAAAGVKLKGVGEEPPALGDAEWLQGKPIKKYKRGETYVICFVSPGWLTTPHVLREAAALQQQHAKDSVQVVCVFVAQDPNAEPPAAYLKRRPEAAKLAVACDKGDALLSEFKQFLGDVTIESAFVVDKKGRVSWQGEAFPDLGPALTAALTNDADGLSQLVAGRYSIKKDAQPHVEALTKAMGAKQWDQVVAEVDALLALDAKDFADIGYMKYQALVMAGKTDEAAAWGRELLAGPLKDDEGQLNSLAWWIVDPAGGPSDSAVDLELALSMSERACELSSQQDAALLDTLARAHYRLGHRDQAIELQKKAVGVAFGEMKSVVQKSLDEYLAPPPPDPRGVRPKH